jgi:hypothetical protein
MPAVLVIKVDEDVAVQTVGSEQDQYDEIRNQQCDVEPVGVVKALKVRSRKCWRMYEPIPLDATTAATDTKFAMNRLVSQILPHGRISVPLLNLLFYPKDE